MGRTFRTGLQTETVSRIRRSEWDTLSGRGLKWKVCPGIWLQRGMHFPVGASNGKCIPESAPGMGHTFRNSPQPETATRNRHSERDALSLGALSGKCIPESGLGVGCTFRNGPQPETVSQNRHSERDMLSGTAFKRKLHPVLSVQAGTRFPLAWPLGKRGPDRGMRFGNAWPSSPYSSTSLSHVGSAVCRMPAVCSFLVSIPAERTSFMLKRSRG